MTSALATRLAVLGSPIAHSLSPRLHSAAYRALGLPWSYEAIEVTEQSLGDFVASRDEQWRGLSLTMPLKRSVVPLLAHADALVELTEAANTVLFGPGGPVGFNTDIAGIETAFRDSRVTSLREVAILGGGATATSALVACQRLGATAVQLWVREPSRSRSLAELAIALGIELELRTFGGPQPFGEPDAVISTLPGGTAIDIDPSPRTRTQSVLFDVAYDPWPTRLASSWADAGGAVISGLEMLINQALVQVRIFLSGDPAVPLPDEQAVLEAMRSSVRR